MCRICNRETGLYVEQINLPLVVMERKEVRDKWGEGNIIFLAGTMWKTTLYQHLLSIQLHISHTTKHYFMNL